MHGELIYPKGARKRALAKRASRWRAVALRQQLENAARVVDEAGARRRDCSVLRQHTGRVAQNKQWQRLVLFADRRDYGLAWARKR